MATRLISMTTESKPNRVGGRPMTGRPQGTPDDLPVLWHLKVSHYNEKVRWALDYKGVPHARRALHAGFHRGTARRLSGGDTLPVLVLDGRGIGDSTRIIAELERLHPEPPLYPADPEERRRALELEEFFDEELGPYTRLLVVHHLQPDAELMLRTFTPDLGRRRRLVAKATWPRVRRQLNRDFGIDDASVEGAFAKLRAAGERFRAELGPSGYLAGPGFSVADLTLAALVAPVIAPEQFPYTQPQRHHPRLERVRAALDENGILKWAHRMYARHRGSSAEVAAG
jgi:glutathione S-transferase